MKRNANEMYFQLIALLMGFILIHAIFVTLVRPNAESTIRQQVERAAAGEPYIVPRSFYVVIKDVEQEACFILMFWAFAIMGYKARVLLREESMFEEHLIAASEGSRILVEDTSHFAASLRSLPRDQRGLLLPRVLDAALLRFQTTSNVQSANEAVSAACTSESERLDSELSMIRYVTWAIPSIGFIGTVRGIGGALAQAHEAMEGDLAGITSSLGVAFNSTFVALLISMFVMFFMHQLQLMQERLVLDTQGYCEQNLLRFLKS